MPVFVKVHQAYREVIAVCDSDLIGKKFEEGKIQLDVSEAFFGGDKMDEKKATGVIKEKLAEDACFNFVGKEAVRIGIKAGAIDENCMMKVKGIPYALLLV